METGRGGSERLYLSIAEAAALGPFTPDSLRDKIKRGVLVEGVHFTRPHGSRPLIVRAAFLRWLAGDDADLRKPARPKRGVNWSVLGEAAR